MDDDSEEVPAPTSVVKRILSAFLDDLGAMEGFELVAAHLRTTIVEKNDVTERGLRDALFADLAP